MIEIYHNHKCSKSRQTLAILEANGVKYSIRLYLIEAPSQDELRSVLVKLGCSARDMMRKGESVYKDLNLANVEDAQLIEAMASHPILIERPIVIKGKRAVIARPPELAQELL